MHIKSEKIYPLVKFKRACMQCNAMEICGNHIHGSLKTVDFLILCKVKKNLSKNNLIKGKKEEKFNYTFQEVF